jgi:hypothetical protein
VTAARRKLVGFVAALVVVAVVFVVTELVRSNRQSDQKPPAFVAAPGKFRVPAQHGDGNQTHYLTFGSTTVTVSFGRASRSDGVLVAGMSLSAPNAPGAPSRPYATYRVNDAITLGAIKVVVLAIYLEPNGANDAVDLMIYGA